LLPSSAETEVNRDMRRAVVQRACFIIIFFIKSRDGDKPEELGEH
jgi:hypothetical protein